LRESKGQLTGPPTIGEKPFDDSEVIHDLKQLKKQDILDDLDHK
jgi:hypothetical protein